MSLFGFGAPMIQVYATIGSDKFCDDNPGHFACDDKVGDQDEDEDNNYNDRECENPPTAASCNNNVDARGVSTENNNDDWNDSCRDAGYDDG